jgi:uncharacterized protein
MLKNYRRCVSCRKIAPKAEFWRVVRVFPTQQLQLDEGSGRSAYLCPNLDCLKRAEQKKRLGRALKVTVPEAIYTSLAKRLLPVSEASAAFAEIHSKI